MGITLDSCRATPALWNEVAKSLDDFEVQNLLSDWNFLARDEQLPPTDDYKFWLYMAGRGSGKTRTGAEWTRQHIQLGYNRGGLIAPTAADVRDVMIEGESGLLAVCRQWDVDINGNHVGYPLYEPSRRRVTWENGAFVSLYSADEPERLRGPQHSFLWTDEVASWRRAECFDQALFGLRLGKFPKVFISTTPKPKKIIRELYENALDPKNRDYVMTSGSTERNKANLSPSFAEDLRKRYRGTSLEKQELEGLLLDNIENALWNRMLIEQNRLEVMPTVLDDDFYFRRIIVGVDPATTDKEGSDETGIIVAGLGSDGDAYVLADYSGKYSPAKWGDRVAAAMRIWQGDMVVVEANQGGDMTKHVLASSDADMIVKTVHASRGKMARAEPIAQKYEQGRVHHVGRPILDESGVKRDGHLDNLEDQMCSWDRLSATYSPDRIDALVWCIHELMIDGNKPIVTSRLIGAY